MTNCPDLRKAVKFYIEHWNCDYDTRVYHGCYVGPDEVGGSLWD